MADGAAGTAEPTAHAPGTETLINAAEPAPVSQHHIAEGDTVVLAINGEKHSFVHVKRGL